MFNDPGTYPVAISESASVGSSYAVRPAEPNDAPFLYACYRRTMRIYIDRTWGWNEDFQSAAFRQHMPWHQFQIIVVDGVPAGAARIFETPGTIELEMLIIDPQFQSNGIGTGYVEALLGRACGQRRSVKLRVLRVNPARALFERLGFMVVGEDAGICHMRARP